MNSFFVAGSSASPRARFAFIFLSEELPSESRDIARRLWLIVSRNYESAHPILALLKQAQAGYVPVETSDGERN